jgi:DNA-binding PadR family transcriptional regulator
MRRRPPGSGEVTRLTVLAMVSAGVGHGYGIRREIERMNMSRWADIQEGSIYAALRRLAHEGLIREAGREQEGRGPPRTVFEITVEGRQERDRLLRRHLSTVVLAADPVDAALAFFVFLDPDELAGLLEERLASLEAELERLGRLEAMAGSDQGLAPLETMIEDHFAHERGRLTHEADWTRRVLRHVRDGRYDMSPDELTGEDE